MTCFGKYVRYDEHILKTTSKSEIIEDSNIHMFLHKDEPFLVYATSNKVNLNKSTEANLVVSGDFKTTNDLRQWIDKSTNLLCKTGEHAHLVFYKEAS